MIDRTTINDALNTAFSHKYHSMARYIIEAEPYVRDGREPLRAAIDRMAREDRDEAVRLAELIQRLEGIPQPGTYHHDAAELNYLDLDYLAAVLADKTQAELELYDQARQRFADDAAAGSTFEKLAADARARLDTLQRHLAQINQAS
jgi:bacterioferritin (cytochrome b1)